MQYLRFVLIDEIEAMTVRLAFDLENSMLRDVQTKNSDRYQSPQVSTLAGIFQRGFGGVNVFLLGDLYQLTPVGNVAFMSNPRDDAFLKNVSFNNMMTRVWSCDDDVFPDSLQELSETEGPVGMKVLYHDVNHRSGDNVWYSQIIDSCRCPRCGRLAAHALCS